MLLSANKLSPQLSAEAGQLQLFKSAGSAIAGSSVRRTVVIPSYQSMSILPNPRWEQFAQGIGVFDEDSLEQIWIELKPATGGRPIKCPR